MNALDTIRRAATASVMLEWAWDPYRTAQQHAFLFNVAPDPVTADNIRQMFGDEAAEAWLTIRKAKADFLRIVAAPQDEPGPVDPRRRW